MNQSHGKFPNVYVTASFALRTMLDEARQAFAPGCFLSLTVRGKMCSGLAATKSIVLDSMDQSGNALAELVTSFENCSMVVIVAADMNSLPSATFFEGLREHSPGCEVVRLETQSMSFRFYTFEKALRVARSE